MYYLSPRVIWYVNPSQQVLPSLWKFLITFVYLITLKRPSIKGTTEKNGKTLDLQIIIKCNPIDLNWIRKCVLLNVYRQFLCVLSIVIFCLESSLLYIYIYFHSVSFFPKDEKNLFPDVVEIRSNYGKKVKNIRSSKVSTLLWNYHGRPLPPCLVIVFYL